MGFGSVGHAVERPVNSSKPDPLTTDNSTFDDRIPILIGVTGHRAIPADNLPQIERAVIELIERFRRRFPNTPLRFLSGLAEGADRVVAKVALAQGAQLVAALPMPAADYEADFQTHDSLLE